MNVKSNVQKLGRAMLLPVAAMPLAGLIMRLSADDMLNIPVIGAAGNAVFGNLDILFAIGVAIGFVKGQRNTCTYWFFSDCYLEKRLRNYGPRSEYGDFWWNYFRFSSGMDV